MKRITYADALRGLNEAVRAKGYDYVYERRSGICWNVFDGNPDCIVGHALVWLGVPVEWFAHGCRENDSACDIRAGLFADGMFDIDADALDLFSYVQAEQDNGSTWGAAVARNHVGEEAYNRMHMYENVPA